VGKDPIWSPDGRYIAFVITPILENYPAEVIYIIPATGGNLKAIDEVKKQRDMRVKKRRKAAEIIKDRIERLHLRMPVMVGEEDRLFGSVTNNDVTRLLEVEGIMVDKRAIDLEEPIKALGMYAIPIKLEKDAIAHAKLLVEKKIV
jgi:large subunit ribosomal protein L9